MVRNCVIHLWYNRITNSNRRQSTRHFGKLLTRYGNTLTKNELSDGRKQKCCAQDHCQRPDRLPSEEKNRFSIYNLTVMLSTNYIAFR